MFSWEAVEDYRKPIQSGFVKANGCAFLGEGIQSRLELELGMSLGQYLIFVQDPVGKQHTQGTAPICWSKRSGFIRKNRRIVENAAP